MRYFTTCVILLFSINILHSTNVLSEVQSNIESLYINIETAGHDLRIAKKEGIQFAKRRIIDEMLFKARALGDINFNDLEIDSCIESFQVSDETFSNNEYRAIIKIDINKDMIAQLIANKAKKNDRDKAIKNDVSIDILSDNISNTWRLMKEYISKQGNVIKSMSFAKNRIIIEINQFNISHFQENMNSIARDSIISNINYE